LFYQYYFQVISLIKYKNISQLVMADTNRRVPLWLIALVGGLAVLTVLGLFIYGSYSGLGSSL
jgi:photosystem II PsbJ protein